jgi:hypothetical protein
MLTEAGQGEHRAYRIPGNGADTTPLTPHQHYLGVDAVTWFINKQGSWVSAKLEPHDGHSVQELHDLLFPFAREVRIVNGRMVTYEGEEEPLRLVENMALIHVLPFQTFSRRYF